jgi:hypothetical protein
MPRSVNQVVSLSSDADNLIPTPRIFRIQDLPLDEKRVLPRFPLEMPVWLRLPGSDATVHAKTRDVSASGVFFYVNCEIRENSEIEFTMTLPPELTRTAAIQVSCKGKVVRIQNDPASGKIGIAAAIYSYDFLAQAASSSFGDA